MANSIDDPAEAVKALNGWDLSSDQSAISKTYVFRNFVEAFGFMTMAAIFAEKINHHPEWSNVYKTVEVRLTTHDTGGLTELDLKLAAKMEQISATMQSS